MPLTRRYVIETIISVGHDKAPQLLFEAGITVARIESIEWSLLQKIKKESLNKIKKKLARLGG